MSSSKKFVLKSSDGETFEIDEAAAGESETIKQLIESNCAGNVIPLPNVTGSILAKVVEYCKKHAEFDDTNSLSKYCHSIAKLSINEIADKDSKAKDIHSPAKLSIDEIADKDSEAKDCHSPAKLSKDCHSPAKLSIDKVDFSLKTWDDEFVQVDQKTLFDLMLAANYLHIKSLIDLTCNTVADMIRGKTPEEIREIFNIKNDLTPEEEEEIRRENDWAFE